MKRKERTTTVAEPVPGTPERASHTDVRQRAMLARLSLRKWGATITDDVLTEDVASRNGIADQMGRYEKKLLSKTALAKMQSAASKIKAIHERYTLPWGTWGTRILSSTAFPKYRAEMRQAIDDYEQIFRDELEAAGPSGQSKYEEHKLEAKTLLGNAWRETDYPSLGQLRRKFQAAIAIDPIPAAADFRIDLGAEATEQIRSELEGRINDQINEAMTGVFEQLKALVERLVTALAEADQPKPAETAQQLIERLKNTPQLTVDQAAGMLKQIEALKNAANATSGIRSTLLKGIETFCDTIPMLNVTNDTKLDEFAKEIRQLVATVDAKQLREADSVRSDVREQAEAILAKMNDWLGA